ncbi:MAG: lytic murein transglycosylase [Mailhella sp.]|nr:lytic murein transglycosylase [Mailhella sp.]
MKLARFCRLLVFVAILASAGCAGKESPTADVQHASSLEASIHDGTTWQEKWEILSAQLQNDGLDAEKTRDLFSRMDTPPTLIPMGTKVRELYSIRFQPKPKAKPKVSPKPQKVGRKSLANKLGVPGPWFAGVVTKANAQACREFIRNYRSAFTFSEKRWGVPPEVAAALLFVETRLGRFMGREKAFYSLASMSVTRSPKAMAYYLDIPGIWDHLGWVRVRMDEKADWAYDELKALLEYCFANDIDPYSVPGSVYGAVGMCQFMPSNISRYAADGDGDGRIDLFSTPDSIASLSQYLSRNGWKRGMSLKGQIKVLMHYNRMEKYARTILALARSIKDLDRKR